MLGIDARAARFTWTAAAVLLAMWTVYLIRQTLFIFVIALMLAYLVYPLLDFLDRKLGSKSRTLPLALTFLVVIAVPAAFVTFVGSSLAGQATQLAQQIRAPGFAEQVRSFRLLGMPLGEQIAAHYNEILSLLPQMSLRVISASSNAIYIVIVPILSFFILKDGRRMKDRFLALFHSGRAAAEDTLNDAHTLLLQYMRALLTLCLATLIVFSTVLTAMGVPYSVLLASLAFPLEFVPLVGPLISAGIVIGVSAFSGYQHVLLVIVFLALFRVFQDYVLSPHLMSKGVELHPLLVIFGVFAGDEIGGIPGVFLSVPVLALMRLGWHHLRKRMVTPV